MYEKKFFTERVRRFTEQLERTLYDAYVRTSDDRESRDMSHPPTADEINLISWPQSWPDARHGFEAEGPDRRTVVQTHVVTDEGLGAVLVYHGGRFVGRLERPGQEFWDAVKRRKLPGATDREAWQRLGLGD